MGVMQRILGGPQTIAAAGEAVLAEDPTHGQETFYAIGRQLSKGPPPKVRFRLHVLMC